MDNLQDIVSKNYTLKECLTFYKNIWMRNTAARLIDVLCDQKAKAVDPEAPVKDHETGLDIPVKFRLEKRKMAVEDAMEIVAAAEELLALSDEDLASKLTPAALSVDKDMMPAEAKEGDVCDLDDGSGKGTLGMVDGKLICVAPEAPAAATDAQTSEEKPATTDEAKPDAAAAV